MGFERFRQGQYLGITPVRSGTRPLRATTLVGRSSPSPSELFAPKIAGMTAATYDFDIDPELMLKVAAQAFLERIATLDKTASEPLFSEGELIEFFKQAGLLSNIKAWGSHLKNTMTGGDFASQMKSLTGGASSGMSGLKQTLNPALQQVKGPGELALAHAAQQKASTLAADRAAAQLKMPDTSGIEKSFAPSPHSPQAWGLPATEVNRATAPNPFSPQAWGLGAPIKPGDFLRDSAFGRDARLGPRAARLTPATA